MSQNFSLGDLVWAKMKGFPPWPGIIKEPPEEVKARKSKPGVHCIYFFGSKNYGWIEESCIKLYESNKDEIKKSVKTSAFMAAVTEIENYMKNSHNKDEVFEKLRQGTSPKKVNSKSQSKKRNSLQGDDALKPNDKESSSDESDEGSSSTKSENTKGIVKKEKSSQSTKDESDEGSNPTKTENTKGIVKEKSSESDESNNSTKSENEKAIETEKYQEKIPDTPKISLSKKKSISKRKSLPKKEILSEKEKLLKKELMKKKSGKRQSSGASTSEPKTKKKSILNSNDVEIDSHDESQSLSTQIGSLSDTQNHQSHINYSSGSRPQILNPVIPELPTFDVNYVSDIVKNKTITPSELTFGFLGTGLIGSGIIKNLVHTKHKVVIWNRSPDKSEPFKKLGVEVLQTPSDVVSAADITFCCVSDEKAAKNLVFGNCGVSSEMKPYKAYVEMSGIDPEASLDISNQICSMGGKYLEVRFLGSRKEAEDGSLVVIAAGDSTIYHDCESCFQAIGIHSQYLGSEIGKAARLHSVLQLMVGVTVGAVAEGLALADRVGIEKSSVFSIVEKTQLSCPMVLDKCSAIKDNNFSTNLALNNLQKGVKLALNLGDSFDQRLPLAASANELFIHAKRLGYKQCDSAAVFLGTKI